MATHNGGIRENAQAGRDAEGAVYRHLVANCSSVERTGKGSDFYATGCKNGVGDGHHEAKAGDAPLTPRQQEMQGRLGPRYHVDRARCDEGGCEYP